MIPNITTNPLSDALLTVGRAHDGLRGTLNSIEALTPARDAPDAERAKFEAGLANVLSETLRSLVMVSGELAFHLRRIEAADRVAASAASAN